jgi:hypothetical protein
MIQITCRVDTSMLEAGIDWAQKYTTRTLPQAVNTALYWVAINAREGTPFVTQDRINQDMGIVVKTRVRGKLLPSSSKLTKNRVASSGRTVRIDNKDVPRAAAIVAARANAGSAYNKLTTSRWAMTDNPFKGVSRAAGRAAMAALVRAMLAARRGQSTKYLYAGWLPAISILYPHSVQKFIRGGPSAKRGGKINFDLGAAQPAQPGVQCAAMIQNSVGMVSKTGPKANEALVKYASDALQRTIDSEGQKNMDYALREMEKEMAAMVNKLWR